MRLFFMLLMLAFLTPAAKAQQPVDAITAARNAQKEALNPDDPDVMKSGDELFRLPPPAEGYVRPNFQRVVRSLWGINAFSQRNIPALDEYIHIQYCPLFVQYQQNDFLWKRIREAVVQDMRIHAYSYPIRYEVLSSLKLNRFDFNMGGFVLQEDSRLKNVGFLDLLNTGPEKANACLRARSFEFYPFHIQVKLDNPISLPSVPMSETDAQNLVRLMNAERNADRMLNMIVRIRLTGTGEKDISSEKSQMGTILKVKGRVESLTVYGDRKFTIPVFTKNFTN